MAGPSACFLHVVVLGDILIIMTLKSVHFANLVWKVAEARKKMAKSSAGLLVVPGDIFYKNYTEQRTMRMAVVWGIAN